MSRSSLSLWEMLPVFIMLTLKGQDLEPWMRQLIDMINGTQNTVKEMQKGINTLHGAVYQLIMPPDSNTPQEQPETEPNNPPVNDLPPIDDQPYYQTPHEPDFKLPIEQTAEQLADEQTAAAESDYNTSQTDTGDITIATADEPPPSVLPAEMPRKSKH
ncbi:hypothetical protein [Desulfoscipio sp. XC116]|uniref:hypothetical protein n=1 Tax=Desulfoscipio sp. XC116 TaxID=3144975 RepID=UPI00325B13E8